MYHKLNDQTALAFLDYYEQQLFKNQAHLPLKRLYQFNHGQLALKSDYYECLNDPQYGQIYRFTYHVSSYLMIITVQHGSFGKIGEQRVCFARQGLIEAKLDPEAAKEWRHWYYIDWLLLPLIAVGAIGSGVGFGVLLVQLMTNLAWYVDILGFSVLGIYVILCLRYCIKNWRQYPYLRLWLKRTQEANEGV